MGPISSMYSVILISPHQAKSTSPLTPPILQLLANLFYLWNQPPAHAKRGSRVRLYPLPLFLAPYSGSLTMSSNCRNVKEIRSVPLQPPKSKPIPTRAFLIPFLLFHMFVAYFNFADISNSLPSLQMHYFFSKDSN